jgi:hypothetical protein
MIFGELEHFYHQPLFDLISQSRAVHLQHWRGEEIQRCSLLSIKTGGCSEDCAYCAQSAHYSTGLEREELLSASFPAPIQSFTVTNFWPQKIPRLTWMFPFYVISDCSVNE